MFVDTRGSSRRTLHMSCAPSDAAHTTLFHQTDETLHALVVLLAQQAARKCHGAKSTEFSCSKNQIQGETP